ncbi:LysR substrate-binding domain-containing protein [Nocardia terpenica]|uniref:LysR family transcriptional regulator n=1 Tax=Nocardia terpenica TaxID=455432 RepID=A0A6G9YZ26_9NOCA|nr:LysR substrate-binding domain-containing protein [Nocardia terpenica]QIS18377.1 LysR family transcriptional regulator [Nocardia terpenica]
MKSQANLAALRALEAAERLHSYSLAAQELFLTHSAVSHQIRQLETMIGAPLFVRSGNTMRPTAACRRLAASLRRSLHDIDTALQLAATADNGATLPLELSAMTDLADAWLIPKLGEFTDTHPGVRFLLRRHADSAPPDPASVDIGIWHRPVELRGFRSVRLPEDTVIAVCSPELLARYPGLTVDTLPDAPLLHFGSRSWREFLEAAGCADAEPSADVTFTDAGGLLGAALAGQGVAMIRTLIATPYLETGRLLRIGDIEIPAHLGYFVTWREDHPRAADITSFADWLCAQLSPGDRRR